MFRITHRLFATLALLLAMLTVTPSAMADMRGIDVSGWQRVAQLHNLKNPNLIYPGQQLRY